MWQRMQTIFLIITALCMALMVLFPIWTASGEAEEKMLFPLHYTVKTGDIRHTVYFPYALCALLAVAAATVAVIEIGKFKDRLLQLKLGALNSLLMVGSLGSAVYFAIQQIQLNQAAGHYGLGMWLPAVGMVSNLVANRFIRRDEKIVRNSERIR